MCLEEKKWYDPKNTTQQSNTEVETLFFRAVSLPRVQEDFTILRGQWTCGGKVTSLSQNTEDRSWMGHPAWQWSKRYRQDNQGVTTEEEAHWGHGNGVSVTLSWGTLWGELKLQVPKQQPRDLHDQTSFYRQVGQSPSWNVGKPGDQLQESNNGFSHNYWIMLCFVDQILIIYLWLIFWLIFLWKWGKL